MAKIYKAYKLKTDMDYTFMSVSESVIEFIKKMYDYVSLNFGGFARISDWDYTSWSTSDPEITMHLLSAYYNIENGNTKQIMMYCLISEHRYVDAESVWSFNTEIHVCQSDHSGTQRSNGICVQNERTFVNYEEWGDYGGYEFFITVYTDANNNLVGLSSTQADQYAAGLNDSGVMLFDRKNGKAYITRGFYSDGTLSGVIANGRFFAPYKGTDLSPQGQFAFSCKSQYQPYATYEPVILKDIKDDFIKYEGDIELVSLGSYELKERFNQRITTGGKQYIHLDQGKLYLPISEYNEVTISL